MKKIFKMIKPGDYFLILIFIIISFLPLLYFRHQQSNATGNYTAVISVKGKVIEEWPLVDDGETQVIEIDDHEHDHDHGDTHDHHGRYNRIVREGNIVRMEEANCADQLCVEMAPVSKLGDTIICLPHQVLIEVISDQVDEVPEVDVIS